MDTIDYRLIGMDAERPPILQKMPCIDLFFELNEAAPKGWCDEFLVGIGKQPFSISIDPEIGLHIETWCRTPDQIAKSLETVKALVATTNSKYTRLLEAKNQAVNVSGDDTVTISAEQRALNELVARLVFDE